MIKKNHPMRKDENMMPTWKNAATSHSSKAMITLLFDILDIVIAAFFGAVAEVFIACAVAGGTVNQLIPATTINNLRTPDPKSSDR